MPGRTGPVDGVDFPGRDGRQTVSVRLLCHETRSCRDPPFFLYFGSQLDRNSPFQVGCGIDLSIDHSQHNIHFSMRVTLPPPRAPLTSLIVRLLACYDHSLLACHSLLAFLALQALLLVCMISCTLLACLRWSSDIPPLLSNTELFAYNAQVMSVAFP
mgnify:CR=1 FL=1